jgi:hypothetical protein
VCASEHKFNIKCLCKSNIPRFSPSSIQLLQSRIYISREILRSCSGTVPSKVSKIVIFVYVLIKCCMCFDKMSIRCCKMCVVL